MKVNRLLSYNFVPYIYNIYNVYHLFVEVIGDGMHLLLALGWRGGGLIPIVFETSPENHNFFRS